MTIFLLQDAAHGENSIYQTGIDGYTINDEILKKLDKIQEIKEIKDSGEIYIIGEAIRHNYKSNKFLIEGEVYTKETLIMKLINGLYGALFVNKNRDTLLSRIDEIISKYIYKSDDNSISDDKFITIQNKITQLIEKIKQISDKLDKIAIESYGLFGELCVLTKDALPDDNIRKNIIGQIIIPLYIKIYGRVLNNEKLDEGDLFNLINELYENTVLLRDTHVFDRAKEYERLGKLVVLVFGSNHTYYQTRGAIIINDKVMVGGFNYKSKYLKYKQKYLELKNNLERCAF